MNRFKPLNIGNLTASLPIIQGGMGVGISLSSLAGAVAKAGGVGIISTAQIGFRDPDFYKNSQEANLKAMETELKKAREIALDGILGFNIMVATKNYVEYVKTAVKIGADIIISGAGLPVNLPEYVKGTATKIAPIVSTVKSAKVICKLWDRNYKTAPDLVVVEGPLAGGHLGFSREQLTELGADTDQVSKTYHKAEYEEEVKGIIALVKEYGEKYGNTLICGTDIRIVGAFIYSRAVNFNISFSSLLSIIDGLFCVVQKGSSISGNIREYRYSAGDRDIPDGVGRSGIRDGVHYTFAAAAGFIYIRSRF